MLLALDIGNTSVHVGLFEGSDLTATWRLNVETERSADEYGVLLMSLLSTSNFTEEAIDACIIGCDVPPMLPTFQSVSERYFDVTAMVVGHGLRTGVRILYDDPRSIGATFIEIR